MATTWGAAPPPKKSGILGRGSLPIHRVRIKLGVFLRTSSAVTRQNLGKRHDGSPAQRRRLYTFIFLLSKSVLIDAIKLPRSKEVPRHAA